MQSIQNGLGSTYPYKSVSLVLSASASTAATPAGTCTDVGTGLALSSAYFVKAPYPQAGSAYAGSTVAISLVSTMAAYVLSISGTSAAFNLTAAALGIAATYPGGDLSS